MSTVTFSDEPIEKVSDDQLNFKEYSDGLAKFVSECDTPLTVGLQGQWGTGKTSLMKLLKSELQNKEIATSWVNTWEYSLFKGAQETTPHILLGMVSELKDNHGDELAKTINSVSAQFDKTKKLFGSLIWQIVNNQLGADIEQAAEDAHLSARKTQISDLKIELSKLIQKIVDSNDNSFRRIVFFVDDLDRMNPTDAVEVLEALTNVFDIRNCVFILAIDYEVVVKGLRNKFGDRAPTNEREFRSFFDKIIQVPFRMPSLDADTSQLIKNALVKLKIHNHQQEYQDLLKASVGNNPRSLKRFLNTFSLTRSFLKPRDPKLDLCLAVATAMQISYPKFYTEFFGNLDIRSWTNENLKAASEDDYFLEDEQLDEQLNFDNGSMQKFNEGQLLTLLKKFYDEEKINEINLEAVTRVAQITSAEPDARSRARKEISIEDWNSIKCSGDAEKAKWFKEVHTLANEDKNFKLKATMSQLSFRQGTRSVSTYMNTPKTKSVVTFHFPAASKAQVNEEDWKEFLDEINTFSRTNAIDFDAEIKQNRSQWELHCTVDPKLISPNTMVTLLKLGSQLHVDKMQK